MGQAVKRKTGENHVPSKSSAPSNKLTKTYIAVIPEDDEEDIDALLGDEPEKPKNTTQKKTDPRGETMKGPLVAFKTKKGKLIIAHAARYYVVRVAWKLHYKPESECTKLPADWKEGDVIPPGPGTVKP